jgi:hypothetical protein
MMQLLEEDRKKLHNALVEASNSLTRIDAERDLIKNITNDTSKNFQIPKKTIKKLIRVYHKQNFSEEVATHEEFETLYETVTKVS